MENLGNNTGTTDAGIINKTQEIEKRISTIESIIEDIVMTVVGNAKCKRFLTQNLQEFWDTMKRPNLGITGIENSENSKIKGPENHRRKSP